MANNQKSNKRGGMYWQAEQPFLSVTSILSIIDKPALRYWFGRQVYLAMVANPNLNEKEAMASPYQTTQKAMDRGSTVHSAVEAYKHGNPPDLTNMPEQFKGYVSAFYRFAGDLSLSVLEQEKTVFSKKHKYAGTLDLLARLDGKVYVLDVKTGKDIYAEAFLQTSAYRACLMETGVKIDGIGVILLQENGDYKFQTTVDCDSKFDAFLACKKIYEVINEETLTKLKYL